MDHRSYFERINNHNALQEYAMKMKEVIKRKICELNHKVFFKISFNIQMRLLVNLILLIVPSVVHIK